MFSCVCCTDDKDLVLSKSPDPSVGHHFRHLQGNLRQSLARRMGVFLPSPQDQGRLQRDEAEIGPQGGIEEMLASVLPRCRLNENCMAGSCIWCPLSAECP